MRNVEEARLYFREGTRALGEANRSATALWQAWGLLERDQVRPRTPDPPHLPQPSTGFCFKQRTHTHTHPHHTHSRVEKARENACCCLGWSRSQRLSHGSLRKEPTGCYLTLVNNTRPRRCVGVLFCALQSVYVFVPSL